MSRPRVLISGAGIAGAVVAYWLGKYDFDVVLLERTQGTEQQGQVIDVEGPARQVVSKMGVLDAIKSKTTEEAGIKFVDERGNKLALIEAAESKLSNEIEIMRPDLQNVLLGALDEFPNVELRRGSSISSIEQSAKSVTVTLDDGSKDTFDILVVADGLRSRTRRLIVPPDVDDASFHSTPYFTGFFSIPANGADRNEKFARNYIAPGRRSIFVKPLPDKSKISCYVNYMKYDEELSQARQSRDPQRQKEVFRRKFQGVGWEGPRIIEGMMKSDNWYCENIGQVFLDKWAYGRCVLVGDAAYCPSPLTGEGANLAMLGAYLLALNLIKEDNVEKAFEGYDADLRPYVNKVQPIALGGWLPTLIHPQTFFGTYCLRQLLRVVDYFKPWQYFGSILQPTDFDLPEMPMRQTE